MGKYIDVSAVNERWPALYRELSKGQAGYSEADLTRLSGGFVTRYVRTSLARIVSTFKKQVDPGEEDLLRASRLKRGRLVYDEILLRREKRLDLEGLLPYRSKADRGLRLTRFPDYYDMIEDFPSFVLDVLDFDYILAMNLAVLRIRDREVYMTLREIGAFDAGIKTYMATCSRLSHKLKFSNLSDDLKVVVRYIEADVLTGFRNLPDPSFDYWREAESLANGGRTATNWEFKKRVLDNLFPITRPKRMPDFLTWIKELSWLTAGASSIGKVEVNVEGEVFKFKARKNCLPFLFTAEELYDVAIQTKKCVNKILLKNELKKVRLAVASDIGNYLLQSYFLEQIGDSYKDWPGNTLAETAAEERVRLAKMSAVSKNAYGLPFDYAAFDHQPSRREIKAILMRFGEQMLMNEEQKYLYEKMLTNLDDEELIGVFEGITKKFKVKGGLMSGYRITSIIGNCWNTWMTECATVITDDVLGFKPVAFWIRGDDSAVFFDTWEQAVLFRSLYDILQADGNDAKFGIVWEKMEFLRTAITPKGCFGYPNRAAVAITQRKPWSGERWQPMNVVSKMVEAIDRVARRQWSDLSVLRNGLLKAYSRASGISELVFYTPEQLGGAGLLPFKNLSRLKPRKVKWNVEIKSTWMKEHLLSIEPELPDVDQIVQDRASAVVASDDIIGISSKLRSIYKKFYRGAKFERVPVSKRWIPRSGGEFPPYLKMSELDRLRIEARMQTWGDIARKNGPVWNWVRKIEKRGCPRWLSREFVSHNAPGLVNIDAKFRGLLSSDVLSYVLNIDTRSSTAFIYCYSLLVEQLRERLTRDKEYDLYGHM